MQTPPHTASAPEASPYSAHIPALDGLRGLAVLGVMASHLFPGTKNGILHSVDVTLQFGATGVDLFFVLSGFLITGILYDSLSDRHYFRKFYARRILRIFPLYYGVLFILLILTPWLKIQWQHMYWVLLFYLQNTNIAGPFYWTHLSPNVSLDHFWTLAVEEQFYFVWPLAIFFIRKRRNLMWTCLALSVGALALRFWLAFHHTIYHIINRSTVTRADSLLIGAMLALALRGPLHNGVLRVARNVFAAVVVIVAALNVASLVIDRHPSLVFSFDASYLSLRYTLMAVGSAALLAWSLQPASAARSVFENKTLRFFGKYSYGLYVLHFIFLQYFLRTFKGWGRHFTSSTIGAGVFAGILSFGVAVVMAYASYNLYEKQFLRLKRHFAYTRADGRTETAVAAS